MHIILKNANFEKWKGSLGWKKKDFEKDNKMVGYGRPDKSTICSHRLMTHKTKVYKADGKYNDNLAAVCYVWNSLNLKGCTQIACFEHQQYEWLINQSPVYPFINFLEMNLLLIKWLRQGNDSFHRRDIFISFLQINYWNFIEIWTVLQICTVVGSCACIVLHGNVIHWRTHLWYFG